MSVTAPVVPQTKLPPKQPVAPKVGRRVQRGIDYLDSVLPGWEIRVVPARIDLYSSKNCIIGQVFGHLDYAPSNTKGPIWAWRRGFIADNKYAIRREWVEYISFRRAEMYGRA